MSGFTASLGENTAVGDTGPKHSNYECSAGRGSEGDLDEGGGTGALCGTFPLVNRTLTSSQSSL